MRITEALLAEHVVFHNLFDYIERTVGQLETRAEVVALACMLEAMLAAHGQMEDTLVMEPLEHCLDQLGQREVMDEEHHHIEISLESVKRAEDDAIARRLLLNVVLAARRHFDREERLIFPLAEKYLSEKTQLTLGQTWLKRRKQVVA